jgi:hypothetical protein
LGTVGGEAQLGAALGVGLEVFDGDIDTGRKDAGDGFEMGAAGKQMERTRVAGLAGGWSYTARGEARSRPIVQVVYVDMSDALPYRGRRKVLRWWAT